jgi:hypothetical protein
MLAFARRLSAGKSMYPTRTVQVAVRDVRWTKPAYERVRLIGNGRQETSRHLAVMLHAETL